MLLKNYKISILFILLLGVAAFSFTHKVEVHEVVRKYQTENIIVLIIDGPRLTETFGDDSCRYIPNLSKELAPQGVLIKGFRNNGPTYTNAGHSAITTGHYQRINNNGEELPKRPSMFQYFLKNSGFDSTQAMVIASKGKLSILTDTKDKKWRGQYRPFMYCGTDGKGEGYTSDVYTWRDAQKLLKQYHPKLVLINLLEVDVKGHQNDWQGYLKGLRNTDRTAKELWDFIQNDSIYSGKTSLIITNDHGRHLDGRKDGFVSHGDNCEGCRQMYLIALGPDFKRNVVLENKYEQIDISATIAQMLHFDMITSEGIVMKDLFLEK
jgi:predicted AlkP superfamily pyrophosphatase or phosphodiesterase